MSAAKAKRGTAASLLRHLAMGGLLCILTAALCLTATSSFSADEPAVSTHTVRWAKGRLLVQPRAGLSDHQFDLILRPHLARRMGRIATDLNIQIIELPEGVDEMTVARALRRSHQFKFAEPDRVRPPTFTPNDPNYSSEWHEANIGAPAAWDLSTGQGVTIAILDSGVDATHPDLANALVPGWNFFDNNSNTADIFGHGTKVAGTAAASGNNAIGVVGVAWSAKIMPIRVTDTQGFAYDSMIIQGLTWAADNGARVANVSFLGISENPAIVSAAQYMRSKGGIVVTSAGNDGVLETFPTSDAITSVAATDSTNTRASFSSFGDYIDVAAPGVGVFTTVLGGGYGAVSGTSFSAPITAGVYALMMSANPSLSPSMLDNALFSTALDRGTSGWDQLYGWGRIDAFAAVTKARQTGVSDTQAPSVAIVSPMSGTVRGLVPVDVAATDNIGVTRVEMRVNGVLNASDSTAPYAFTWDTTTYANGVYTLQAVAYDAAGNQASSAPISLTVANAATSFFGFLSGSGVTSAASVNLTTTGTVDWAKWPNYIHKALGGSQISTYALVGTGSAASYTNDPRTLTWSIGTPVASGSDTAGVSITGVGNGFSITVPADTTARTLKVYVGGLASGGKLVAHLSDASVPDYIDTAFSGAGQYDTVYTLTYQAASIGQQLVVSWTQASGTGNVTLQGAALAPAPTGPSIPTGVSASNGTSSTSVTVTWTASTNATSYTVYRSSAAGQLGTSVGTTSATSMTDASVTPGTLYYYSVVATGAGGRSVPSAQDSGYAGVPPPLPPAGVSASDGSSSTSVTISWAASTNATSYTVYRSTTSGQLGPSIGSTSTTSLTDTTVTPGIIYYYTVTATGLSGTSAASPQNSGFASMAPLPPTGVSASDGISATTVTVTWAASTNATSYTVYRSTASGQLGTSIGTTGLNSRADITVTPGITYYYSVTATGAGGTSAASAQDSGFASAAPLPPKGVSASDGSSATSVIVSWAASTNATSYTVYRSTASGQLGTSIGTTSATTLTDTTVTLGITYYYTVTATGAGGTSAASAQDSGFASAAPLPPTGVSASDGSSATSVTISWTASANATSYTVYRSASAGQLGTSIGTTSTTTLTDTTVTPGITYYYSVTATGGGGTSAASAQNSGFAGVPPPLPPTGVSASDGSSTSSVTVSWAASTNATSYTVYRSTASGQLGTSIGTTSATTLTDTTVTPGITYYYSATATGVGGTSAASAQNSGFAAVPPPLPPTGVSASDGISSTSVTVSWAGSTNATGYAVYRSASAGQLGTSIGTTSATTLTDTTITPGIIYYYTVTATGGGGTSAASAQNSGFASMAPLPPTGVSASDGISATTVIVTWAASTNATSYTVYRSTASGQLGTSLGTTGLNSRADITVTPGITYYYSVTATGAGGTSAASAQDSGFASAAR